MLIRANIDLQRVGGGGGGAGYEILATLMKGALKI